MNAPTDSRSTTKEEKFGKKRLNGYNSRRIIYGKIPHSGIFGTIFPFYYYIFTRQTRNTGRCPILALTSSFSLYAFNIFDCFQYEQVVPHCLYCRYCALQYLIWSGSNTVCLRAADPPASLRGSHRLTGFSTLPFERDRTPLRWISRTSAGEEVVPLSSHQQRTRLRTLIGVCQLARTLFRLSMGNIPARVSGHRSC